MDDVLTTEETAELIKLSGQTVLNMARSGELPAIELGNRWLFIKDQIMKYMRERARAEQIKRQESHALQIKSSENESENPKTRGRPRKKTIDIAKYIDEAQAN